MSVLHIKALAGLAAVVAVLAALLFLSAGTLDYWQAWTFLVAYAAASLAITLYLMKYDPQLLARRVSGGPGAEKLLMQKLIMAVTSLGFIAIPIVAGFDHRLGWSQMPAAVALGSDGLMLLGWLAVFFVFKENSFASATIEVAPDQKVISTGPYALVRHPMYSGGLVLLFAIPIALGSWWGVLIMGALLPALVWRLFDEEKFLTRNLPGYTEYQRQVRYRLVPGVW
jgi:protein-S-isoprenylcysteine O-methyltransferase Ste14